jgi:phosphohistidine phosphatase SixA
MWAKKELLFERIYREEGYIYVCGDAKRMAKEMEYPVKKILIDENLYMGDSDDYFKVIQSAPDSANKIMLFSHNPGITYFANHISDQIYNVLPAE